MLEAPTLHPKVVPLVCILGTEIVTVDHKVMFVVIVVTNVIEGVTVVTELLEVVTVKQKVMKVVRVVF